MRTSAPSEIIGRAAPGAKLRVDANAGYTAREALALARACERLGLGDSIECWEQPCAAEDRDGMREVTLSVRAPVIADESVKGFDDFRELARTRYAGGVNLKLAKLGGVLVAVRMGLAAQAEKLQIMTGGMVETRLGMTAAAHVACALGGVDYVDLDTAWLLDGDPYEGGYEAEGPYYTMPVSSGTRRAAGRFRWMTTSDKRGGGVMVRRLGVFVPCAIAAAFALQGAACSTDTVPPATAASANDAGTDSSPTRICDAGSMPTGNDASRNPFEAGTPATAACDMNGRWLVALRVLADALGQTQASHNWFYYEVHQDGEQVTVTKGLHCGFEVKQVSSLGADVDSSAAWPALLAHDSDTGRKGTMVATATGCQLDIEKRYTVRGATQPFYGDPSQPMPTSSQQATCTTPGWEDWDGDGKPGITLTVSGAANGHLYCAQRDWNQFSGEFANGATTFKVPVTWDSGQDVLGYDGSSLITESSVPDPDATQHFVTFVKLDPTQATGDDTAICASLRSLLPTLAPDALQ